MTICSKGECTGCWACIEICPKDCIKIKKDGLALEYPIIDDAICVKCGLCRKVCPNNTEPTLYYPKKVFAAWSKNSDIRKASASGGIATELYRHYLSNGGVAAGVLLDNQHVAKYILLDNLTDICKVRNSKYTYSNTNGIFRKIKVHLESNISVLFIGLPCHVAALLNYLKKAYDNLTTVDIICHGIPPAEYLKQHIAGIEHSADKIAESCSFRDSRYGTHNFVFALYDKSQKCFYHKRVQSNDVYQLGYHKSLIYRDNCYQCKYARAERVSDITIGDFSGLGRVEECGFNNVNVSCVMTNSVRGESLILGLGSDIEISERPLEEALNYEKQLKEPSIRHINRTQFETLYRKTQDFKYAATMSLRGEMHNSILPPNFVSLFIKSIIRAIIPLKLQKIIKSNINKVYDK